MAVNNKLKYIVHSASAGDREIFPTGESSLRLKIDLHDDIDDPLHDYIYKLSGKLVLTGSDFEWILALETDSAHRGDDLLIEVIDDASGSPVDLVPGTKLILNDAAFDLDKCLVEIPITTPDKYEAFNKAKGDEVNFFDLMVSGTFYDINVLDYIPKFEVNYSEVNYPVGTNTFDITDQHFAYYPNKRAQYPGFGPEGETEEAGYPNAAVTIFDTVDLVEMTNNSSGENELGIGTYPFISTYPDPLDAKADGWRLYAFKYEIFNNVTAGSSMGYLGHFCWIREIKDVPTGTAMAADWVLVSSSGGTDRFARPAMLVHRTNINKTSFRTESDPTEARVNIMQTTYVVGMDIANIIADSTGFYSDGTMVAPTDMIMSTFQDFEYQNYYSFTAFVNGKRLNDFIEFLISKCDPTLTVKSDFLQINPPSGATTTNYVTGIDTFVDDIIMFQKSDVKRPFATNRATKGLISTEKLLYVLFKMCKLKHRIDGNDFRIEHISSDYFVRLATRDLTTEPLNRFLAGTRRYSYDQEVRLPGKETFKYMEMRPQGDSEPLNDMNGVPITYDGSNVDRSKENGVFDHIVDNVTTDVSYILQHNGGVGYLIDAVSKNAYPVQDAANDTTISDEGWVLMASRLVVGPSTSERYMVIGDPIIGANREMNNVLGWAYLHDAFFRTNANTKYGQLNNAPTTFDTTKYIRKSIALPFIICDITTFDPFELITSALGDGIVKTAEYNFQETKLTVVLGYPEV